MADSPRATSRVPGHQRRPVWLSSISTPRSSAAIRNSLLNWTERIIRMRKEVPEIGWGDFAVIASGDPAVLIMRYDWRNNSVSVRAQFRRQAARDFVFRRADRRRCRTRQCSDQSLGGRSQPSRRQGQPQLVIEGLWLPLVPRRRPGLSVAAHRHRRPGAGAESLRRTGAAAHCGDIACSAAAGAPAERRQVRRVEPDPDQMPEQLGEPGRSESGSGGFSSDSILLCRCPISPVPNSTTSTPFSWRTKR